MSASWHAFNEKKPWGKYGTPVHGDNIEFSRERHKATQACRKGNATPEQAKLVEETDQIIQEALGIIGEENPTSG